MQCPASCHKALNYPWGRMKYTGCPMPKTTVRMIQLHLMLDHGQVVMWSQHECTPCEEVLDFFHVLQFWMHLLLGSSSSCSRASGLPPSDICILARFRLATIENELYVPRGWQLMNDATIYRAGKVMHEKRLSYRLVIIIVESHIHGYYTWPTRE